MTSLERSPLWGFALFLNVVSVGLFMYQQGAGPLLWGNLFGCVVFGAWMNWRLN